MFLRHEQTKYVLAVFIVIKGVEVMFYLPWESRNDLIWCPRTPLVSPPSTHLYSSYPTNQNTEIYKPEHWNIQTRTLKYTNHYMYKQLIFLKKTATYN